MIVAMRWVLAFPVLLAACDEDARQAVPKATDGSVDAPAAVAERTPPATPPASPPASPPAAPAASVPTTPADYVGQHVLLCAGARLHIAADEDAPSAVLALRGTPPPTHAMEVVGHHGEFLAVRSALSDHRCVDAPSGLAAFDVKLWVRPHDLAPVLGVTTEVRGAGQDVATLWPGAPVTAHGGRHSVDVGGLTLTVELDPAVVGTSYGPAPLPAIPAGATALDTGEAVTWNGIALDEAALLGSIRGRHPAATVESAAASGRPVATVWARCAELVGTVDDARAEIARPEPEAGYVSRRSIAQSESGTWRVSPGAAVSWRDGTPAGVVVERHAFARRPSKHGDRSCFEVPLAEGESAEGSTLTLCVPAREVAFTPGHGRIAHRLGSLTVPGRDMPGAIDPAVGRSRAALDAWVDRTGEGMIDLGAP